MTKYIVSLIATFISLIILLGFTSPNGNNIIVYLAVFGLIYAISFLIIYIVISTAYTKMSRTNKLFIAVTLAFTPVALIATSTLSNIKLLDILLSIGVPAVVVWYGIRQGIGR